MKVVIKVLFLLCKFYIIVSIILGLRQVVVYINYESVEMLNILIEIRIYVRLVKQKMRYVQLQCFWVFYLIR